MDATTKTCTKCGLTKPIDDFYCNYRTGRRKASCAACCRTYGRAYFRTVHQLAKGGGMERLDVAAIVNDSILNGRQRGRGGDISIEANESQRDDAIAALFAASRRWVQAEDREDRAGARDAVVFRARQLIEAQGRCEA